MDCHGECADRCECDEWWVFKGGRMLMICVCEKYDMKLRKFGHDDITTSSNFIPAILEWLKMNVVSCTKNIG